MLVADVPEILKTHFTSIVESFVGALSVRLQKRGWVAFWSVEGPSSVETF